MGIGHKLKCKSCNNEEYLFIGCGFMYPRVYENTIKEIVDGKYGAELKELVQKTSSFAVNCENELFYCDNCGNWNVENDLSIYAPKDGLSKKENEHRIWSIEEPHIDCNYVAPSELETGYKLIKEGQHICSECGYIMRKLSDGEMLKADFKCRECGEKMELIMGDICWD